MWDSSGNHQQPESMSAVEAVLGDGPQILGGTAFLMFVSKICS